MINPEDEKKKIDAELHKHHKCILRTTTTNFQYHIGTSKDSHSCICGSRGENLQRFTRSKLNDLKDFMNLGIVTTQRTET